MTKETTIVDFFCASNNLVNVAVNIFHFVMHLHSILICKHIVKSVGLQMSTGASMNNTETEVNTSCSTHSCYKCCGSLVVQSLELDYF